jgi:hypothetical protein
MTTYDWVGQFLSASRTSAVVCDDFATVASVLGRFKLRALAWNSMGSYSDAYSAVEKRKKGEVLRKASAEGSAARARAPTNVFAMFS